MKQKYSGLVISFTAVFFLAGCGGMKPKMGGGGKKRNNNNNGDNRRQNELAEENDELRRLLEQANFERNLQLTPNAFGNSQLRPGDIEAERQAGIFRDANGQITFPGTQNNFANNNGLDALPSLPAQPEVAEAEVKRILLSNPSHSQSGSRGSSVRRRRVE